MRIILKILAVPFVAILTIVVPVLVFIFSLSSWILAGIAFFLGLGGVGMLFAGYTTGGIGILVIAFLISPFGLPLAVEWIAEKLDGLNGSLHQFIMH